MKKLILVLAVLVIIAAIFFLLPQEQGPTEPLPNPQPPTDQKDKDWVAYFAAIDAEILSDGRVLVLYGEAPGFKWFANTLVLFNQEGEVLKHYDLDLCWPHSLNPSGKNRFLISDHCYNRILEVDLQGQILGTYPQAEDSPIYADYNGAVQTKKGKILGTALGMFGFKGLIEFDRSGKITWKHPTKAHCHDANELPNGNIIYTETSENRVVEIDRKGKEVWSYASPEVGTPKNAKRLKNGNTIIAYGAGIVEVTPKGKTLRSFQQFTLCYNIKIQDDGSMILSHPIQGVLFLDADWKIKKTIKYRAPESFKKLRATAPPEKLEHLKNLGYL